MKRGGERGSTEGKPWPRHDVERKHGVVGVRSLRRGTDRGGRARHGRGGVEAVHGVAVTRMLQQHIHRRHVSYRRRPQSLDVFAR